MKATITEDRAVLELSTDELETLYGALDRNVEFHRERARDLGVFADSRARLAEDVALGRVSNRRLSGELRARAVKHADLALRAGDMLRVLHGLGVGQEVT